MSTPAEAVLVALADAVFTFGPHGVLETLNPAGERLFGVTEAQVRGASLSCLVPGWEEQLRRMSPAGDRRGLPRGEVRAVRADGSTFPLELTISSAEVDGRPVSVAVGRNVSGRKAAEHELARLRRQNDLILESAGEGICGIDAEGRVTFVNAAFSELIARPPSEVVGRPLYDLVHHCRADGSRYLPADWPIGATMGDGRRRRTEGDLFCRADGSSFPVELFSSPIVEGARVVGSVVSVTDITERRSLERMKDEFVSLVSHELRTPLTSIRGSLGLLVGGAYGELPEATSEMLRIAVANTDRLIRLVNDILDLERIEADPMALMTEAAEVADLMAQAVHATKGMADEAGVTLAVEGSGNASLDVDRDRIVQALTNLLGNAVKFSPAGETVRLRATLRPDAVAFLVEDRGRGVPAADLDRIFEPFHQVDASDGRDRGGSGLGLAIVRSIARHHGGDVSAESVVGEGSTFRLVLPCGRGT